MADIGNNKAVAAGLAGAACTVAANILNHVDPTALHGWMLWTVEGLRMSDSMSAVQMILVTALVYFTPHGGNA